MGVQHQFLGGLPGDAFVGDGDAVRQGAAVAVVFLVALAQVALEKQLPRDQDKPNIIRALTREALQENLEFERLAPKPVETRDFFQVIPFDLQFAGNLQSLARFLASLGQQDRIFQAQGIKLNPRGNITDGGGVVPLSITLMIQTYAYSGK